MNFFFFFDKEQLAFDSESLILGPDFDGILSQLLLVRKVLKSYKW